MAKVSVIIPAYNSEKYIEKALNSLSNQTYDDFDLTIVNDGSTDNTLAVIDDFAASFGNKLRVINQENQGVAKARKTGFLATDSDYLAFMDSDDFVNNIYLEELVKTLEEQKVNICMARPGFHPDIPFVRHIFLKARKPKTGLIDLLSEKEQLPVINTVMNMKLYRRNFVTITDKDFIANEDLATTYYTAAKARYIAYANKAEYHYMPNNEGLVSQKIAGYEYEKIINTFLPLLEMKRLFEADDLLDIYYSEIEALFIWQLTQRIRYINKVKIDSEKKNELLSLLISFLDINFPNWENNKYYKTNFSNFQIPDMLTAFLAKGIVKKVPFKSDETTNEGVMKTYKKVASFKK